MTKSQHVKDRWYIVLEDGTSLKADINVIADMSLYVGRELDDDEMLRLREMSSLASAKERAYRLLSSRRMSRKELKDRLVEKGETEEASEAAADLMERIGAIDDREYALDIVSHYSGEGYGTARIKNEFIRRGIQRDLWDEALETMPDTGEIIDRLVENRLRGTNPDRKEVKRLTDMLMRRGYQWQEIKDALGRYDEMLEETD